MPRLDAPLQEKLTRFAQALVDQQRARVIVPPQQAASGFWFGGGNMLEAGDGTLSLVGRYRNAGDSRTGLGAGERGLELAIFASKDQGLSFEKVVTFSKSDLDVDDRKVLSIEGSALHWTPNGVELFVSTEKSGIGYPPGFTDYLKPGTGVWTIERMTGATIGDLASSARTTVLASDDPRFVHLKDPFVHDGPDGETQLLFCSHPFCWTSSNTGYACRPSAEDAFAEPVFDFFPRGVTWDVAMTRGTCLLDVPRVGAFQDKHVTMLFYDGGECVRDLDEHASAVSRPRGYSCEELGGAAFFVDGRLEQIERLSQHRPLFVSPHGTGCSRYVDVLQTKDGTLFATWQQSQTDGSQPLVMNVLSADEIAALLD